MKILIATPLYPPDIAGHAPYVKELAQRLSSSDEVTVLAYTHIPEEVENVRLVIVDKQQALPFRVFQYVRRILEEVKKHEVVFIQNGPSTEIALIVASLFLRKKYVLRLGDETPLCKAEVSFMHNLLLALALKRATVIVTHSESSACTKRIVDQKKDQSIVDVQRPQMRPEILPFRAFPQELFASYESSWDEHLVALRNIFTS